MKNIAIKLICLSFLFISAADAAHSETKEEKKEAKAIQQSTSSTGAAAGTAPCISWTSPLVKPRAVLLCIHGLGLYSGSYQNFGMRMSRMGIQTYAIDVRGFGSWMKQQGRSEVDFADCLNDVKIALQSIHSANPGLPVFLLGESMGGAIVLRAASLFPELIDGLISSVPAGERFKQKKEDLKVAVNFIKGPNKQFDVGTQIVDQATQSSEMRKDWQDNPLDRMDLSAKELMQFQKFMNENHDSVKQIKKTPVLMVQGINDKLVKPTGTWDLYTETASDQKTFVAVPSEHLVFEEQQDRSKIFDGRVDRLVASWILAQAGDLPGPIASDMVRSPDLTAAITLLVSGQYDVAEPKLKQLVANQPNSGECHYWLGVAYLKNKQLLLARHEFVAAMSLGNDSGHSSQANNYLLSLPSGESAPAQNKTPAPTHPEISLGEASVVAFYAPWCEQCQNLDTIFNQAKSMFGTKLKLVKINVDDPANRQMVKSFNVGPIPTIVYLTADGHMTSTLIGKTSFINFAQGVSTIMKPQH